MTLEHKNRDGKAHRLALSGGKNNSWSAAVYNDLKRRGWPTDDYYTVLCFNCNHASWKLGTCPHQAKGTRTAVVPRTVLLLDCDGILADFVGATLRELRSLSGRTFSADEVSSWEIFRSLPDEMERYRGDVYGRLGAEGGCYSIPLLDGAVDGVGSLRDLADVVVVTAPFKDSLTWQHERERWLRKHFGLINVVHAIAKERVHGDIFVDDKPSNVREWQQYWASRDPAARAYLWVTPRAKPEDLAELPHVSTWEELHEKVRSFHR